ncbi:MAG TPA: hypothetical protein PKY35_12560 [Candidatus Hydrogenedentes bacterium]|nr:hypothetical protein [Candidatus Hydrogenedentota bacterium]HOL77849.1 hypothetical protein [Candidatus Hydrogenedentota bacterium]HPO86194.1 hypothetical protein [Candidatus Hydrogenedentota bacterium]
MFSRLLENLARYDVVLEPDENTPEWWAGAPSVVAAPDGTFWLAARMREGRSPRGRRGYEIRILQSNDGIHFELAHRIRREDAGVPGFERPALVYDAQKQGFRLYGCSPLEDGWAIIQFDDASSPCEIDPKSWRKVVAPTQDADLYLVPEGYKDPFVFWDKDRWRMFVIGFERVERIHHFDSIDGTIWRRAGDWPVMQNDGWHNYYTRPACIVPLALGYLMVYEGSHVRWRDPAYNIATGLAYSYDLNHFIDLTPDAPLLKTTTPGDYHTWRYSHWLCRDDAVYVYFEAARPNNTNEIRVSVLQRSDLMK